MRAIMSVILTIVLSVASATAGICHYCNHIIHTVFVSSTSALITEITRDYDGSRVQDLAIVRDGNRIVSMYDVSDDDRIGEVPQIPSGDYVSAVSYDANGNITRDDSRNVTSITYHDYLDLPRTIKIGVRENHHRYRPDGVKSYRQDRHSVMTTVASVDSLGNTIYTQKPTTKVTTRNYIGDFIKTGNYTWEVPTDDGHIFIDTRNKLKTHYYYVRDYLGSTRAVVDTAGVLLQTMNYYPSGVPFSRMEQEAITDRLHTGKPFLDMNGLGYYDNNARFLDILTGGFISRDALAGTYPYLSPYANCANNPLRYTDSSGKYLESLWDAANIGMGISSLWNNAKNGNVGEAVVDGLGVAVDVIAIILPGVPGGAGTAIKSARAADDVVDITQTSKNASKFNSKSSTTSKTSNEALRKAKDQNGIPRSQQPDKTLKPGTPEGDNANLRANENIQLYEYTNSKGEKIQIRHDKAKMYKDGGEQSHHYNAGKKGEKLKQHHNYEN